MVIPEDPARVEEDATERPERCPSRTSGRRSALLLLHSGYTREIVDNSRLVSQQGPSLDQRAHIAVEKKLQRRKHNDLVLPAADAIKTRAKGLRDIQVMPVTLDASQ